MSVGDSSDDDNQNVPKQEEFLSAMHEGLQVRHFLNELNNGIDMRLLAS